MQMRSRITAAICAMVLATSSSALAKRVAHSAVVSFPYAASLNGTSLPAGQYKVTWQQHSPEATVSLTQGKNTLATTQAKWVDRDVRYPTNAVLYNTSGDGSRRILEIRFAGVKGALVFGDTSPKA